MLRRSTWIVLGLFVLCALGLFLWQRFATPSETPDPTATQVQKSLVFDLGDQEISSIKIQSAEGRSISFVHSASDGDWVVTGKPEDLADSAQIESLVYTLSYLLVDTVLTTEPPLEAMGLVHPAYTISLTLEDGASVVMYIGNLTPTDSGYYVKVGSHPAIVVAKTDVDVLIDILDRPPFLPTPTAETETTPIP